KEPLTQQLSTEWHTSSSPAPHTFILILNKSIRLTSVIFDNNATLHCHLWMTSDDSNKTRNKNTIKNIINHNFNCKSAKRLSVVTVTLFIIFLIAGLCGGLPALVWGLRVLYGHYKSGGRISALVIMLLLSDLLELLLSPYVVTVLLQDDDCWETSWTCRVLTSV
ncbi:hypothetical protein NFI96_009589, partial [Prochilodus magdalenae]